MTSGEFGLSRDMLYLSGLLAGIALGFFLSAFKKNSSTHFRSRRIALTLLFLSLMIASLAVSVIASMGAIFAERGVLVCAGLAVLIFAVAVRFPRAVAYPLIIFGGLVTVWLTWSYLRFPQFHDTPVALVSSAANDSFAVRIFSGSDGENTSAAVSGESGLREKNDSGRIFYTNSGVSVLDFFLVFIELDQIFPVAGGSKRVILREINADSDTLFQENPLEGLLSNYYNWIESRPRSTLLGITCRSLGGTVHTQGMSAETVIPVLITELTVRRNHIHTEL